MKTKWRWELTRPKEGEGQVDESTSKVVAATLQNGITFSRSPDRDSAISLTTHYYNGVTRIESEYIVQNLLGSCEKRALSFHFFFFLARYAF
jgi:hypothetical protein